jgi:hypothetical protein
MRKKRVRKAKVTLKSVTGQIAFRAAGQAAHSPLDYPISAIGT